jgi:hypothetical protein
MTDACMSNPDQRSIIPRPGGPVSYNCLAALQYCDATWCNIGVRTTLTWLLLYSEGDRTPHPEYIAVHEGIPRWAAATAHYHQSGTGKLVMPAPGRACPNQERGCQAAKKMELLALCDAGS